MGVVLACNNWRVVDLGVMVSSDRILESATVEKADIIGLSGLITPSLDEMVHVVKELERRGFSTPVLIGGATTSKTHTAVKITPAYSHAVMHVLDASRAVPVASALVREKGNQAYLDAIRSEYNDVRLEYSRRAGAKEYLSIEDARVNRAALSFTDNAQPTKPRSLGVTAFDSVPLAELRPYIDWTPFFQAWELRGRYPEIFDTPNVGVEAKKLYDDANAMLDTIIADGSLRARAACGLFPAVSVSDDLEVTVGEDTITLHTLRQQSKRASGVPNLALSDFLAPKASNIQDYIGAFVVSAGEGCDALCARYESENDDYSAIMVKSIADRLAEACAEWLHQKVRTDLWGYATDESPFSAADLVNEAYRGIRPAPGYPACPDHTEKTALFAMLDAEKLTGVSLTESLAMYPAASVSGWYFAHPDAKYFAVGKITQEQVADYAHRKGMSVEECERWLSPILAYDV